MTDVDETRSALVARARALAASGPFTADWASLRTIGVPPWFRDAKFGIFVHWLVSAVPAYGTEWYARTMYVPGTPEFEHHLATYGPQAEFGFKDLIPMFRGERFDADAWIRLFRRAGAQYVVPVSEHHDGYALYDSALTRWKAPLIGPGRDVIGELAAAARRAGMTFGVSNHRAEHWWFFNGGTRYDSDVLDPENADLYGPARPFHTQPDAAFLDDWLARLVDTVERYDPALVYFDWWIEQPVFRPYLAVFAAYLANRAAGTGGAPVINAKWDAFDEGAAVHDIERGTARSIQPRAFQNDTSASRIGWAHLDVNDFKSAAEVVGELIDVVAKNGSLLLNVGPRPDGTFVDDEVALLEGIGDWLAMNGEAVYGTRPWLVFGEGPTEPRVGSFADTEATAWTSHDLRFTSRDEHLVYASYFTWPDAEAVVRSLGADLRITTQRIVGVAVLGHGDVAWRIEPDGLRADLAGVERRGISPVLRIELEQPRPVERHEPGFPM
ncbi:alpha-L-fucosidase [uncultured Amnibacterium sp.]|uniref:alpha-L-fucosidase n=1 Tax=uncultured Amnibacterium sp. TaxID=1631851 RepID=UPI0035CC3EAB